MNLDHMSHFRQRMTIASITLPLLLACIYLSFIPAFQPVFVLIISGILSVALWEYYHMANVKGFYPSIKTGISCAFLFPISIFLSIKYLDHWILPLAILLFFLAAFFLHHFTDPKSSIENLAITCFGISYLVLPLSTLILINYFFPQNSAQDGRWWLFYLLAVSKLTDTGAYFTGKAFGNRKLAAIISPQKTVEGALGGLISALLTSIFFWIGSNLLHLPFHISFWESVFLGISIGILAQFGDLAESLLKRDAGIKDSNQIPGLGGILDMVDSLIFTAPLIYLFLLYRT